MNERWMKGAVSGSGERVLVCAAVVVLGGLLLGGGQVQAQEATLEQRAGEGWGFDVETDPLAFIAQGHSLHAGIWWDDVRLDVGSFGLVIPEFVHGQSGFEAAFTGFGTKADVFWGDRRDGLLTGVELAVSRVTVRHLESTASDVQTQVGVSGRVGYRWASEAGLYVQPWVGVGYMFGGSDVVLGGERFETAPLTVFPTVHVGYQID